MEINQHIAYSESDHIEQLNNMFYHIHNILRTHPLLYHDDIYFFENESVSDPNSFQIKNTVSRDKSKTKALFIEKPNIVKNIFNEIGFGLEYKLSTIQHSNVTNGVFLRIKNNETVRAGTLVGFVPGCFSHSLLGAFGEDKPVMMRNNGKYFDMRCLLPYPNHQNTSLREFKSELQSNQLNHQDKRVECFFYNWRQHQSIRNRR